MTTEGIFRRIVEILESVAIPYMLTGSFASSLHGAPRTTQDIDFVIAPTHDQVRALVRLLPKTEYYVDEAAALDAATREGMFNVIDLATGWKVDFIIRKSRPFSVEEFSRRVSTDFMGLNVAVASAEDVVLAKLEWAKAGESQRQLDDVVGILRTRMNGLDLVHIRRWVVDLDLEDLWTRCAAAAGIHEDSPTDGRR